LTRADEKMRAENSGYILHAYKGGENIFQNRNRKGVIRTFLVYECMEINFFIVWRAIPFSHLLPYWFIYKFRTQIK